MKLALINKETKLVENVIVPPDGAQAYFLPDGYDGKMCEDDVNIGDTYKNGKFIPLNPPVEETPAEEPVTE